MDKLSRGKRFEADARSYLETQGLKFIASNYRCRWGEIDLIMRDQSSLVFVEVRFRGAGSFVSGSDSVDLRKQRKLCRTALHYLARCARTDSIARFDVVSISQNNGQQPEFKWIKNAFDCT